MIKNLTYKEFDTSRLELESLSKRKSDLSLLDIMVLDKPVAVNSAFSEVGKRILDASKKGSSVILMMGAHVIRDGVQRYLIDMMENGLISCIAMNGAGVIHDYEFAIAGKTTESVATYIKKGQFGLWKETGAINDIVTKGAMAKQGLGESVGREIETNGYPNKEISLLASAYRLGIPVTVHVGLGYDIVHQFPNCNGSAYGETSYRDFLRFVHAMESLEGGVVMNFGSSVMAPEVYLKALSMVRNAAKQSNRTISKFTTLVCDLLDLPEDFTIEADKKDPGYYFRPWKTMLVRTIEDGGKSFYVKGRHSETIPQLWSATSLEVEQYV